MIVPDKGAREWSDLIEGKKTITLQFLAVRLLVGRLISTYRMHHSEQSKSQCVDELAKFFQKNINIPAAQTDLNNIFGGTLK
jgi:hypothetical protein